MTGKKTPLYEEHVKLGASIVDFGGWEMPVQYTNVIEEHTATRNAAGLFDICHMGEILVEGRDASRLIRRATTRNVEKIKPGKMVLAVMCNPLGGILDDLTVYKYNDMKFMVVVNASNEQKDLDWIMKVREENGFNAEVTNLSAQTAKLDLQGPKSQQILRHIVDFSLGKIGFYEFAEGKICGLETTISRSGYTGEDGFEIYFPWGSAADVWNRLLEGGKAQGIKPCGLGARDTLRLEAAMNLYGHEMDETKTPLQARYGWVLDTENDFIGKGAILSQKEKGVPGKLAGFEMVDRGIARGGYRILHEGAEAGIVTSGSMSPTLKKALGLAYLKTELAESGSEFEVEIREKLCKARVVKLPFYKRNPGGT